MTVAAPIARRPTSPFGGSVRALRAMAATRDGRLDLVGLSLLGAQLVWTVVAAAVSGGSPVPVLLALLAAAVALVIARSIAATRRIAVPAAVVAVALVLAIVSAPDLLRGAAGGMPFGYGNANGAFFAQSTVAALMIAFGGRGLVRVGGAVAAVALAGLTVLSGSLAASVLIAVLPAVALAAAGARLVRVVVALCGLAVALALALTLVVAADEPGGGRPLLGDALAERLSEQRLALWHEADRLMAERPLTGVGPLRFRVVSPVAGADPDRGWAHQGFLQQGAEGGLPGFTLLVLTFVWGFARLWATPGRDRVTALGAVALAVLGVHACFDYVLHFPAITMAAAGLVGTGQVTESRRRERAGADTVLRKAAKAAVLPFGIGGATGAGDLVMLLYHRVRDPQGEIDVSPAAFERQLETMAERGDVVALEDALPDGRGGVVVSFDDGHADFHEVVLPWLVRYRVPATLSLATGLVEGEDHEADEPISWSQLGEAVESGVVAVGSHTHGHADLSRDAERADAEMRRSKELIEERLGIACRHFAYPWGVSSPTAEEAARGLFDTAALRWGTNRGGRIDRYRLGRTPVLRSDGDLFFRAKINGVLDGEATLYRLLRRGPWRAS